MIKIALAEDSPEVREELVQLFELLAELEVMWTAGNGEEALEKMKASDPKPELILVDIGLGKMGGIEATRAIKEIDPAVKIMMLTGFDPDENIKEALAAGADGYLLKDEKPLRMLQLIKDTLEGRLPMSPGVARKNLRILKSSAEGDKPQPEDFGLTQQELEVLKQLTLGKNHHEIAGELFISAEAVRTHLENMCRKLDVHSKVEASNIAIQNGWLE